MIIDTKPRKEFEKPDAGLFLGVLADIVYIKDKPTKYGLKNVARLVWILDAKDSEGNFYRVMKEVNQSLDPSSNLFGLATDIRNGTAPPVPFELDELIGSVNQVVVTRTAGTDKRTGKPTVYANVANVLPAKANQKFAIPEGFVRAKDRPARGAQGAVQQNASASVSAPAAAASSQDDSEEVEF
jgi:hypothetical protein